MKFLFDFFPALLFFIAYRIWGVFPATYVIIIASLLQIGFCWVKYKKLEPLHIILFLLLLIFGGMTLYFHDIHFLMWKVSLVNWLLGGAILLSQCFKTNLLQYFFNFAAQKSDQKILLIPNHVFKKLNLLWGIFFTLLGFLNWYVAFHCKLSTWVDFKVFGILGLTGLFVLIQTAYLYPHLKAQN